ncbi:MAG TPA: hypothetical protein VH877_01095 [Polyangia bacterium]|jgi:uncharacterized protein (TIGR02646 family)|nr:hypothetical protein [Polyangia bacterium]
MRKLTRPSPPKVLAERWREWSRAHEDGTQFYWHQHEGRPINQHLLPLLREMTSEHCSFCDGYPMGGMTTDTIEHFFPKARYKTLAFFWPNLFLCCTACQAASEKGWRVQFHAGRPLKPDRVRYEFTRFFVVDLTNGRIDPNPAASSKDQERARLTCDVYDLNSDVRCRQRKRELRNFLNERKQGTTPYLDDYPYRDFIAAGLE